MNAQKLSSSSRKQRTKREDCSVWYIRHLNVLINVKIVRKLNMLLDIGQIYLPAMWKK
jgi:hypothetical protein